MSDDTEYLPNYKTDHLYTNPASKGAFATLVGDSEELLGEINVTTRCKVAVIAFHVQDKGDYGSIRIVKLQYHAKHGWREDGRVLVNNFQLAQIKEFMSIISAIDMTEVKRTRLSLDNLHVGALGTLLSSSKGAALIRELASSPELHDDIYAVSAKRSALAEFEEYLNAKKTEPDWQAYFERNRWIFGHGLNYVFLDKVSSKLESVTTGSSFDHSGKRVDGLMRTRAEVSQFVLVEIKRNDTELLQNSSYRPGCFAMSSELSNAVTQIQKTVFDFANNRFRSELKDEFGNDTGDIVYSVEPKSFLVIGNLKQIRGNSDKVTCFELYRKNVRSPEIITFDELFYRAKCIVENISRETDQG